MQKISFDEMPKVLADIQENIREFSAKLEKKVTDPDRLYTTEQAAELLQTSPALFITAKTPKRSHKPTVAPYMQVFIYQVHSIMPDH